MNSVAPLDLFPSSAPIGRCALQVILVLDSFHMADAVRLFVESDESGIADPVFPHVFPVFGDAHYPG